jgi:hypothetical protein
LYVEGYNAVSNHAGSFLKVAISNSYGGCAPDCYFWYFWLAIQNTTTSQARSLFRAAAVFISFPLARCCIYLVSPGVRRGRRSELLLSPTPPDPPHLFYFIFFWGGEEKKNRAQKVRTNFLHRGGSCRACGSWAAARSLRRIRLGSWS